jgi:hypothetical protein
METIDTRDLKRRIAKAEDSRKVVFACVAFLVVAAIICVAKKQYFNAALTGMWVLTGALNIRMHKDLMDSYKREVGLVGLLGHIMESLERASITVEKETVESVEKE